MQIASVSAPVFSGPAAAASAEARASRRDAGRILGQIRVRMNDHEDGVAFTADYQLRSGALVGAHEGYATLADAVRDLRSSTHGPEPAAAVLERSGRYYGHRARVRDIEAGLLRSPSEPLHLEPDDISSVRDLRATLRHDRLRALVDGEYVRRFR